MTPADSKPNSISTESKLSADATLPSARDPAACQFSLFSLFELTTAAAIAAALVAAMGWRTVFVSIPVMLLWFNARGKLLVSQTPRIRAWLFGWAWLSFLLSLALPAMDFGHVVLGYEAAIIAVRYEFDCIRDLTATDDWSWSNICPEIEKLCWFSLLNVANVVMLSLPFTWWRLRQGTSSVQHTCRRERVGMDHSDFWKHLDRLLRVVRKHGVATDGAANHVVRAGRHCWSCGAVWSRIVVRHCGRDIHTCVLKCGRGYF